MDYLPEVPLVLPLVPLVLMLVPLLPTTFISD
jgi:hypothetical protein